MLNLCLLNALKSDFVRDIRQEINELRSKLEEMNSKVISKFGIFL